MEELYYLSLAMKVIEFNHMKNQTTQQNYYMINLYELGLYN